MKDLSLKLEGDRGASMVEYGLLVALIALMSLSALTLLGNKTEDTFTTVAASLEEDGAPGSNDDEAAQDDDQDDDQGAQDDDQGQGGQNDDDTNDQGQGGQNDDDTDDQGQGGQDDDDDQGQGGQDDDDDSHDQQGDDQDDQGDDEGDDQDDQGDDQSEQGNDEGDDQDDQQGGSGSDDEEEEAPGPSSNPLANSSDFTWWNSTKHGGNGAWRAAVSYGNETNRHQYLTLEVTKIDEKGRKTTITVNSFYVAANGSATFSQWDNQLQIHKGNMSGIVEVQVTVTKITTSDQNWQPFSYEVDDAAVSVVPPAIP